MTATQQPGKPATRWAKSVIRTLQHWNKVLAGIWPASPIRARPRQLIGRNVRGRVGRPAGVACPVAAGSGQDRAPGLASPAPAWLGLRVSSLAQLGCHPWRSSDGWGPGPRLSGPVRIAAWCGAARAGCLRARGRSL